MAEFRGRRGLVFVFVGADASGAVGFFGFAAEFDGGTDEGEGGAAGGGVPVGVEGSGEGACEEEHDECGGGGEGGDGEVGVGAFAAGDHAAGDVFAEAERVDDDAEDVDDDDCGEGVGEDLVDVFGVRDFPAHRQAGGGHEQDEGEHEEDAGGGAGVVADVALAAAGEDALHVGDEGSRAGGEGREAGVARAGEAPEDSEEHEQGDGQAGDGVEGEERRVLAAELGDREGEDEAAAEEEMEETGGEVPDKDFGVAGGHGGVGFRVMQECYANVADREVMERTLINRIAIEIASQLGERNVAGR